MPACKAYAAVPGHTQATSHTQFLLSQIEAGTKGKKKLWMLMVKTGTGRLMVAAVAKYCYSGKQASGGGGQAKVVGSQSKKMCRAMIRWGCHEL